VFLVRFRAPLHRRWLDDKGLHSQTYYTDIKWAVGNGTRDFGSDCSPTCSPTQSHCGFSFAFECVTNGEYGLFVATELTHRRDLRPPHQTPNKKKENLKLTIGVKPISLSSQPRCFSTVISTSLSRTFHVEAVEDRGRHQHQASRTAICLDIDLKALLQKAQPFLLLNVDLLCCLDHFED
jgi:hypothetical protein